MEKFKLIDWRSEGLEAELEIQSALTRVDRSVRIRNILPSIKLLLCEEPRAHQPKYYTSDLSPQY